MRSLLKQLIKEQIDPNPALRKQLVSAVLLGGNVLVPKGKTVGGDFQHVPACQVAWQTALRRGLLELLERTAAGRVLRTGEQPPARRQTQRRRSQQARSAVREPRAARSRAVGAGPLLPYASTTPFPGFLGPSGDIRAPKAPTPWVSTPGQYTAQCEQANGASWLQLTDVGPAGDPREQVAEVLGPLWGTHLVDVNIALGNLVGLTGASVGRLPVRRALARCSGRRSCTASPPSAAASDARPLYARRSRPDASDPIER